MVDLLAAHQMEDLAEGPGGDLKEKQAFHQESQWQFQLALGRLEGQRADLLADHRMEDPKEGLKEKQEFH